MKIILTTTIQKLGKLGDVVTVKSGFAKNFLIPNKKALSFSENNYKLFESRKDQFEKENQNSIDLANSVKTKLSGNEIIILENSSDDGRLYGSVTSSVIADKINADNKGFKLNRSDVILEKPIKEIGLYKVIIEPHSEVRFSVSLIVTRSESEIDSLRKADKAAKERIKEEAREEAKAQIKVVAKVEPIVEDTEEVKEEIATQE